MSQDRSDNALSPGNPFPLLVLRLDRIALMPDSYPGR